MPTEGKRGIAGMERMRRPVCEFYDGLDFGRRRGIATRLACGAVVRPSGDAATWRNSGHYGAETSGDPSAEVCRRASRGTPTVAPPSRRQNPAMPPAGRTNSRSSRHRRYDSASASAAAYFSSRLKACSAAIAWSVLPNAPETLLAASKSSMVIGLDRPAPTFFFAATPSAAFLPFRRFRSGR